MKSHRAVKRAGVALAVIVIGGYLSNAVTRPGCEADLVAEIGELTHGDIKRVPVYVLPDGGARSEKVLRRAGISVRECSPPTREEELFLCFPWVSIRSSIVIPYLVISRSEYVLVPTSGHGWTTTFIAFFGLRWVVTERGLWVA